MHGTFVKIENKKYRLNAEDDYLNLLKDIKKMMRRQSEKGMEEKAFFKLADEKIK